MPGHTTCASAYFVFLWGGVIMWIVFLATFKERLYSYCATASGAVRAECANPSDFLAVRAQRHARTMT